AASVLPPPPDRPETISRGIDAVVFMFYFCGSGEASDIEDRLSGKTVGIPAVRAAELRASGLPLPLHGKGPSESVILSASCCYSPRALRASSMFGAEESSSK